MAHQRLVVVDMLDVEQGTHLNNAPGSLRKRLYALNPCARCPAHCCKMSVLLSTVEAQRIALTLALPLAHVVERRDPADVYVTKADPPQIPLAEGGSLLQLVRSLDTLACNFVVTVQGQGRCGIYNLRPHICALYPFHFDVDGERFAIGNQTRCPTGWMKDEGADAMLDARYRLYQQDRAHEDTLLQAWRDHDGEDRSFAAYIAFSERWCVEHLAFPAREQFPTTGRRRLGAPMW